MKKYTFSLFILIILQNYVFSDAEDLSRSIHEWRPNKPLVHISKVFINKEMTLVTIHHLNSDLEPVKIKQSVADRYRFALKQSFNTEKNSGGISSSVNIYVFYHSLEEIELKLSDFEANGYLILGNEFR
jgi:hypothetical protein